MVDSTNVRLRWSRQFEKSPIVQTFGSAGAGNSKDRRFYKHSAPLEPAIREPLYSSLITLYSLLFTHHSSPLPIPSFQVPVRREGVRRGRVRRRTLYRAACRIPCLFRPMYGGLDPGDRTADPRLCRTRPSTRNNRKAATSGRVKAHSGQACPVQSECPRDYSEFSAPGPGSMIREIATATAYSPNSCARPSIPSRTARLPPSAARPEVLLVWDQICRPCSSDPTAPRLMLLRSRADRGQGIFRKP